VDHTGDGVPPLSSPPTIDLHLHSNASDGLLPPAEVVRRAAEAGLAATPATLSWSVSAMAAAVEAGERLGIRVVAGCEFSTAAPWGEMHVLGYLLPVGEPRLEAFLQRCRDDRVRRAREMVEGLQAWGVDVSYQDVVAEARGAAIGRPHLARVLVRLGKVPTVDEAFREWLGRGRPAYVEKRLPAFREVADLVHGVGGIVSAAHLKERATRAVLTALKEEGLDALETRHPSHNGEIRARLTAHATALGLLRTGGSDWHGEEEGEASHAPLGSQEVPLEWLTAIDLALGARRRSA
jgi:3',5'-nucleoside bisphosphate phosphatase